MHFQVLFCNTTTSSFLFLLFTNNWQITGVFLPFKLLSWGFFLSTKKHTKISLDIFQIKKSKWYLLLKCCVFFFPEHLSWWILSLQYQPDNWKLSHWTASISNLWERFSLIIIRKKCKRVKTMNYIWKAFSFFLLSGKKIMFVTKQSINPQYFSTAC